MTLRPIGEIAAEALQRCQRLRHAASGDTDRQEFISGRDAVIPASVGLQLSAAAQPFRVVTPALVQNVPVSTGPVASEIPFRERPGLTAELSAATRTAIINGLIVIARRCVTIRWNGIGAAAND